MTYSLLLALFVTLFTSPAFSKEISFKWSGVVPRFQSEINSPVTINKDKKSKSWLIEDIKQKGIYDNEYGVVKILTIRI